MHKATYVPFLSFWTNTVPDMERVFEFVLNAANNVDWESEKECFGTFAAVVAEFYAIYPPSIPQPSEIAMHKDQLPRPHFEVDIASADGGQENLEAIAENMGVDSELVAEAETLWAQRDWTIQHVFFPALKLFLKAPRQMASNGTVYSGGVLREFI